mmetsp:Transcript_9116/g.29990  ORF Transcript_9116/g.29990 Transcript_9116/m.29990 type:complete len:543 (+) Transcript_9116:3-1631(+)
MSHALRSNSVAWPRRGSSCVRPVRSPRSSPACAAVSTSATRLRSRTDQTVVLRERAGELVAFLEQESLHRTILGANRVETLAERQYRCFLEQVSVLGLSVEVVLTVEVEARSEELVLTVTQMEVVGLPGLSSASELISLSCVNKLTGWHHDDPSADGEAVVRSEAEMELSVMPEAITQVMSAANGLPLFPLVGEAAEAALTTALQVALDTMVGDSLKRIKIAYAQWNALARAHPATVAAAPPSSGPADTDAVGAERATAVESTNAPGSKRGREVVEPEPAQLEVEANAVAKVAVMEAEVVDVTAAPPVVAENDRAEGALSTVAVARAPGSSAPATLEGSGDDAKAEWRKGVRELEESFRRRSVGLSTFASGKTLLLPINEVAGGRSMDSYLQQPRRLVELVYPPSCITTVDPDTWVIKLAQVQLLQYAVVPLYELNMKYIDGQVFAKSGTVSLEQETLPEVFRGMELSMRMDMELEVEAPAPLTKILQVRAEIEIAADLPGWIRAVPGVQQLGDGILQGILAAIEYIARRQLQLAYDVYARK